ncbi:MAG: hypothetical protein D6683_04050 [Actinomyces sp.]|nr:MAG: hypothetical protein D6683_04050 [Actinomyces sp.]
MSTPTRLRPDKPRLKGHVRAVLLGADGSRRVIEAHNLMTQVGDQWMGERAAGLGTLGAVTGMRLGTGTTAAAKTGAGAAIVTYVTGSAQAIDSGYPTSALNGTARRITYRTTWAAGSATANGIAEAVLTVEATLTDSAGTAADTIARVLLSPTVNKGANDTLELTWTIDVEGA